MTHTPLSISAAARRCHCPRSTWQRAIRAGRLHLDDQHRLTVDELTRAGYLTLHVAQQPQTAGAQQERFRQEDLLRDMQRILERLATGIDVLTEELRIMRQERSMQLTTASAQQQQPVPPRPTPQQQPGSPLAPHIHAIADVAAEYDKLSLAQLAQLLYDRGIYRARDRHTGEAKPVNRGTLQKWLEQARGAGLL